MTIDERREINGTNDPRRNESGDRVEPRFERRGRDAERVSNGRPPRRASGKGQPHRNQPGSAPENVPNAVPADQEQELNDEFVNYDRNQFRSGARAEVWRSPGAPAQANVPDQAARQRPVQVPVSEPAIDNSSTELEFPVDWIGETLASAPNSRTTQTDPHAGQSIPFDDSPTESLDPATETSWLSIEEAEAHRPSFEPAPRTTHNTPRGAEPMVVQSAVRPIVVRDPNGALVRLVQPFDFSDSFEPALNVPQGPYQSAYRQVPVNAISVDPTTLQIEAPKPLNIRRALLALGLGIVVILIAAISGYVVASTRPEVYAAQAEVRYEIPPGGTFGDADRVLNTQAITIRSRSVLEPIAAAEAMTVKQLVENTEVELIAGSEILDITVTDEDPAQALRLLTSVVTSYVAQSRPQNSSESERLVLVDEITAAEADLVGADSRLGELAQRQLQEQAKPTNPRTVSQTDIDNAQARVSLLREDIESLQTRLREITIARSSERLPASVHTEPNLLPDPVAPVPTLGAAVGALIGLAIAAMAGSFLYRSGT